MNFFFWVPIVGVVVASLLLLASILIAARLKRQQAERSDALRLQADEAVRLLHGYSARLGRLERSELQKSVNVVPAEPNSALVSPILASLPLLSDVRALEERQKEQAEVSIAAVRAPESPPEPSLEDWRGVVAYNQRRRAQKETE